MTYSYRCCHAIGCILTRGLVCPQEPEACPAHAHAIDLAKLIGADALAGGFYAGMLTQGGQGGRPAPLASRLRRIPTHSLLNLQGILWKLPTFGPMADRELSP